MTFGSAKQLVHGVFHHVGYQVARRPTKGHPEHRTINLAQFVAVQEAEVTLEEARFLSELVGRIRTQGPIIEIGTLFGWSTRVIAMAKADPIPLMTVDNYSWNPLGLTPEEHQWVMTRVLQGLRIPALEVVKADKKDFYASYNGPTPSLVFLDAGHSYEQTLEDILFARRMKADIICGHDYDPLKWPGVVQAVRETGGPSACVGTLWVL